MLEIAFYYDQHHFQSEAEISLLKKHKIKFASVLIERVLKNETDSVTFLNYNNKGQITSRVTTECATVGCLPYIIRQEFIYESDRIKQLNDYTFKYKYDSVIDYWSVNDTSKLLLFDWEDYTYEEDTVWVESGTFTWKHLVNNQGNVIKNLHEPKSTSQYANSDYIYSDSSIVTKIKNSSSDSEFIEQLKTTDYNKVLETIDYGKDKIFEREFIFDSRGLLSELLNYLNGELTSKTKIEYLRL
jgi:hypothetical protein